VRAATRGGASPSDFDWTGRVALWVGSETGALPEAGSHFEGVTIPMRGSVESLNVTVAASLLLFAAGRAEEPRA
jgi:tRNA G18 (ribose-2'-O)-methylase SpoU